MWYEIQSGRRSGTAPYRMPYSCSTTNVSRHHVDTTVSQLIADLCSGLLIEVMIELVAIATIDGRRMLGDLLIAFARIGRPHFVEALEVVRMENLPCRANDYLLEIEVAFICCKQVAAIIRRDLKGECQCVADALIHRYPSRGRGSRAATFAAVLDVDPPELLGFPLQSRKVGQNGLAQAHSGGSRQVHNGGSALHLVFAEYVDDPFHMFAILALRHRLTNTGAPHSQRLARTHDLHILITAKRSHGPVDAG